LEGQYEICKHCRSGISWVEGYPCKPGNEAEFKRQIDEAKKRLRDEIAKEEERARAETERKDELDRWIAIAIICFILIACSLMLSIQAISYIASSTPNKPSINPQAIELKPNVVVTDTEDLDLERKLTTTNAPTEEEKQSIYDKIESDYQKRLRDSGEKQSIYAKRKAGMSEVDKDKDKDKSRISEVDKDKDKQELSTEKVANTKYKTTKDNIYEEKELYIQKIFGDSWKKLIKQPEPCKKAAIAKATAVYTKANKEFKRSLPYWLNARKDYILKAVAEGDIGKAVDNNLIKSILELNNYLGLQDDDFRPLDTLPDFS
jgi:hypothetical protein